MVNCNTCETSYLNTQILFNPGDCCGVFVFTPDLITSPGPCGMTGPNTYVCPLNVNILENCKEDYKIALLDDNGCTLDTLVLRCSQFEIKDISGQAFASGSSLIELYDYPDYTKIIQLNANNLSLLGEYIALEESAYFYRRVTQTYLNLWCGAESKGMISQIIDNVNTSVSYLNGANQRGYAQFVYSLGNDFLKARVVSLKQLCECGKVCNDQFFINHANPCHAFKNCCPKNY